MFLKMIKRNTDSTSIDFPEISSNLNDYMTKPAPGDNHCVRIKCVNSGHTLFVCVQV